MKLVCANSTKKLNFGLAMVYLFMESAKSKAGCTQASYLPKPLAANCMPGDK